MIDSNDQPLTADEQAEFKANQEKLKAAIDKHGTEKLAKEWREKGPKK
jgi:hypothetical protein